MLSLKFMSANYQVHVTGMLPVFGKLPSIGE